MTEAIITGVIAASAAVISAVLQANKTAAVMKAEINGTNSVVEEKIRSLKNDIGLLSTRVDKHNTLVERMVIVEASTKSAHHRLDEIKKGE